MITCDNCGRVNDESTRICRFCGKVLGHRPAQAATDVRGYAPPAGGQTYAASAPQTVEPYSPPSVAAGYRCPHCGSTYPPLTEKRVSTEGWVVFAALLIFCLPLFWVGLLMKQELRICPMCRAHLA